MEKLEVLIDEIRKFNNERDWEQFHTPKNIAISLCLETSELLECFQWVKDEDVQNIIMDNENLEKIKDEIGDVGNYLLVMCDILGIDLFDAVSDKLKKNIKKYPIHKCKGRADKYTAYE